MNNILNKILMNEELKNIVLRESKDYLLECHTNKVQINIEKNKKLSITELIETENEMSYNYYIEEGSELTINRMCIAENLDENINIYLNGYNSNVILNISSIPKKVYNLKISVYHNNKNTNSKTNIHIVSKNSKVIIENNGYIPKGKYGSNLIQDNKIITNSQDKCIIKPNLFIEEYNIEASHGAYIGSLNKEDLFYLKSRGLDEKSANKMLLKAFLINNMEENDLIVQKLEKIINKYWR